MSFPAPNRSAHDTFCRIEGWSEVLDARGRPVEHHRTYELVLPDGQVLRTHISKPVNGDTYGARLWSHILGDELAVSAETFWTCVQNGVMPARSAPSAPSEAVPLALVRELQRRLHLTEQEIGAMDREEAARRIAEFWSTGGG
ncbi:cytotoxic translational repressor of toxin-antitoxin stability system [uncultured Amnibacterium sp.]|uniref:cytotoxic translational repressor of toxin-antitoxin stability system n=1 Tax=uncultured Amnibacterium sp. TaxID=1631851 RepID=UPI0035CBA53D